VRETERFGNDCTIVGAKIKPWEEERHLISFGGKNITF
jgi:hypothetical protein